ncbi:MAG: DNA translocase FtsK 4TM domain-containing protein [Ruminococcus sp.]|nr:DNA translocase FtsK 4TM domain-containing protein [Ruminococcus sp.]
MAQKKTSKKPVAKTQSNKNKAKDVSAQKSFNPQVKAILLCAAAVILFALLVIRGDNLWLSMRSFMFGVFGICFILVPFVFLYMGIMTAKEKEMSHKGTKVSMSILIVLFSCTLIYLCGAVDYNEGRNYIQALGNSYTGSATGVSLCGMFGAILGYPFRAWFTNAPAIVIVIVALIVFIMLLTGISLVDIANVAHKQYDRFAKQRDERRQRKAQEEEVVDDAQVVDYTTPRSSKDRIDIPLDDNTKKRKKKPMSPESEADQQIIDIINNANNGISANDDEDYSGVNDASAVADKISRRKRTSVKADGAKQADPQTVPVDVDIDEETESFSKQVSKSKEKEKKKQYTLPPVQLLNPGEESDDPAAMMELQNNATKLVETLNSFGVKANITNICRGPSVTRYELQPAAGVKISKITNLADDIALNLAAKGVRIEAPIPGKAAIGIEVPNKFTNIVTLRELIDSNEFRNSKSKLSCVLGRDITGEIVITDLAKMPHLLIAGTTGSGKSVCVNALLMSILFKATPEEVKILLIDPKMVEFSKYKGIPHLLVPVVSDAKKAAGALNWAVSEMLNRYKLFSEFDCKDIGSYNRLVERNLEYIAQNSTGNEEEDVCMMVGGLPVAKEKLPQIVIAIDELADLMMAAPSEVEDAICRLAQMARAAGMHLILATQRPTVNVITGLIKGNIPSRIALKVASNIDSRTILDASGAEKLIGRGDMLYSPVGASQAVRVQGCFSEDEEIERVTSYIKKSHDAQYNTEVEERIRRIAAEELGKGAKDAPSASNDTPDVDSLMEEAIKVVVEAGQASTSLLQRRLKVGYARAGRMIDDMEQMGIVGPHQGSKARDVLLTYNEWLERNHVMDVPQGGSYDDDYNSEEEF